jgi:DNA-directed RNA polymerase specialized sigma24 family protein
MTRKEKAEWMSQYKDVMRREKRLRDEILRWRSVAEKITARPSHAPGGGAKQDKVARAVEEIQQLECELTEQIRQQVKLRLAMGRALNKMPDERSRYLLERYYVDGLTLDAIALEMNYSSRYLMKIYAKAMEMLVVPSVSDEACQKEDIE